MDRLQKSRLFENASRIYSRQGMLGFQPWALNFQGDDEERAFVRRMYEVLLQHNGNSGRIQSFYDSRIEAVLGEDRTLRKLS